MAGDSPTKEKWYADGLRFSCTQCGNCCTGPPGYVWFNDDEADAMAAHLKIDVDTFRERYARRLFGRWTLDEHRNAEDQFDCVFLERTDDGKALCSIYPVRPAQCRTWPFWPENLRSEKAWAKAGATCPGMTNGVSGQGNFYRIEQIRMIRDQTPED
jgi:Fe-S-cluster containining protein